MPKRPPAPRSPPPPSGLMKISPPPAGPPGPALPPSKTLAMRTDLSRDASALLDALASGELNPSEVQGSIEEFALRSLWSGKRVREWCEELREVLVHLPPSDSLRSALLSPTTSILIPLLLLPKTRSFSNCALATPPLLIPSDLLPTLTRKQLIDALVALSKNRKVLAKHKFVEQGVVELCVEYVGRRLREITTMIAPGAGESGQGPGEAVEVIARKLVEMEFELQCQGDASTVRATILPIVRRVRFLTGLVSINQLGSRINLPLPLESDTADHISADPYQLVSVWITRRLNVGVERAPLSEQVISLREKSRDDTTRDMISRLMVELGLQRRFQIHHQIDDAAYEEFGILSPAISITSYDTSTGTGIGTGTGAGTGTGIGLGTTSGPAPSWKKPFAFLSPRSYSKKSGSGATRWFTHKRNGSSITRETDPGRKQDQDQTQDQAQDQPACISPSTHRSPLPFMSTPHLPATATTTAPATALGSAIHLPVNNRNFGNFGDIGSTPSLAIPDTPVTPTSPRTPDTPRATNHHDHTRSHTHTHTHTHTRSFNQNPGVTHNQGQARLTTLMQTTEAEVIRLTLFEHLLEMRYRHPHRRHPSGKGDTTSWFLHEGKHITTIIVDALEEKFAGTATDPVAVEDIFTDVRTVFHLKEPVRAVTSASSRYSSVPTTSDAAMSTDSAGTPTATATATTGTGKMASPVSLVSLSERGESFDLDQYIRDITDTAYTCDHKLNPMLEDETSENDDSVVEPRPILGRPSSKRSIGRMSSFLNLSPGDHANKPKLKLKNERVVSRSSLLSPFSVREAKVQLPHEAIAVERPRGFEPMSSSPEGQRLLASMRRSSVKFASKSTPNLLNNDRDEYTYSYSLTSMPLPEQLGSLHLKNASKSLPRSTSQRFSRTSHSKLIEFGDDNGDGDDIVHDYGHDLASPTSGDLISLVSPANTESTHYTSTPTYHPDASPNKTRSSSSSSPLKLSKRQGSRRALVLVDSESSSPTKSTSATETFTTAPTTPEARESPSPPRLPKQKHFSLSTPPRGNGVGVGLDPSPRDVPLSAIIGLFTPPRNVSNDVATGDLPTAAQVEEALASFVEKEKRRCGVIGIEWHGEGRSRATWLINQVSEMLPDPQLKYIAHRAIRELISRPSVAPLQIRRISPGKDGGESASGPPSARSNGTFG